MKKTELIGKTFNRWTIIEITDQKNKNGNLLCIAKCNCGTKKLVNLSNIKNGKSKSCGCIAREKNSKRQQTHSLSTHPLYARWSAIQRRCYNPQDSKYKFYGEKGVFVCNEWRENPQKFFDWYYNESLDLSLTVDRKNTFGPYSPENCRLITLQEQQQNRRKRKGTLPDKIVSEIKVLLKEKKGPTEIAKKYNISRFVVTNIKLNKVYKNIN